RHNCLIGSSDTWDFVESGRELPVRVQGNWRCNSGRAVLDAALRGFGLCQLPDYYVHEHLRSGALRALLTQHQPPHTAVWALYPQQRHLSPKVRKLVDHLKQRLMQRVEYQGQAEFGGVPGQLCRPVFRTLTGEVPLCLGVRPCRPLRRYAPATTRREHVPVGSLMSSMTSNGRIGGVPTQRQKLRSCCENKPSAARSV